MFQWLKKKWEQFLADRQLAREVDPSVFLNLAAELRELTRVASQVCSRDKKILAKVEQIEREVLELTELITKPEFKRLTPQRKLKLKQSLLQTREQLMESVQTAPSPTKLIQ